MNTKDFYYSFILISIIAQWQASSNIVMKQTYSNTEEIMIQLKIFMLVFKGPPMLLLYLSLISKICKSIMYIPGKQGYLALFSIFTLVGIAPFSLYFNFKKHILEANKLL